MLGRWSALLSVAALSCGSPQSAPSPPAVSAEVAALVATRATRRAFILACLPVAAPLTLTVSGSTGASRVASAAAAPRRGAALASDSPGAALCRAVALIAAIKRIIDGGRAALGCTFHAENALLRNREQRRSGQVGRVTLGDALSIGTPVGCTGEVTTRGRGPRPAILRVADLTCTGERGSQCAGAIPGTPVTTGTGWMVVAGAITPQAVVYARVKIVRPVGHTALLALAGIGVIGTRALAAACWPAATGPATLKGGTGPGAPAAARSAAARGAAARRACRSALIAPRSRLVTLARPRDDQGYDPQRGDAGHPPHETSLSSAGFTRAARPRQRPPTFTRTARPTTRPGLRSGQSILPRLAAAGVWNPPARGWGQPCT